MTEWDKRLLEIAGRIEAGTASNEDARFLMQVLLQWMSQRSRFASKLCDELEEALKVLK